jgi:hypothetical protein
VKDHQRTLAQVVRAFQQHPPGPEFDYPWERISGWGLKKPSSAVSSYTCNHCGVFRDMQVAHVSWAPCVRAADLRGVFSARKRISSNANVVAVALPPLAEFFFMMCRITLIIITADGTVGN